MIEITRSLARELKSVFRKLAPRSAGVPPQVSLQSGKNGLCVRLHRTEILAQFHQPGELATEELILPMEALADFEGRDDALVHLELTEPDSIRGNWDHGGVPRVANYQTGDPAKLSNYPPMPKNMAAMEPGFLHARAEASLSTGHDHVRFATQYIQLKGRSGAVVASDGRQLLYQNGFTLPWRENLLIPGSPAFATKELNQETEIAIGKSDTHVVLQAGPWTLYFRIEDGKYPEVEQIIPKEGEAKTRLRLDGQDMSCLTTSLAHLPGAADSYSPIELDLNGQVLVRAKADENGQSGELVLARSETSGEHVCVRMNRTYLARAARLGLPDLYVHNAKTPIVFHDQKRKFVVVPLITDPPAAESDQPANNASSQPSEDTEPTPERRIPDVNETNVPANGSSAGPTASAPPPASNGAQTNGKASQGSRPRKSKSTGMAALIEEAEALKNSLRDLCGRAHTLAMSLKRHRKQSRLVQTSLKALKDLQHIDA